MSTLKDKAFLDIATRLGQLGTCDRAHVGAVIVKDGRCISWGYNGAPAGMPHCEENNHGWGSKTINKAVYPEAPLLVSAVDVAGCRNVTHAEANAICFAARQGISTEGCTMYVERSPCLNCSHLIIAAGIERVVVSLMYRDTTGWELLNDALIRMEVLSATNS